ncbi:hypothetical protein B6D60_04935, partial [candidate division KSB1 bacterium 4484_87]
MTNKTCVCSLVFTLVLLFAIWGNLFADDLTVSWNANTENDLAGYKVYFGTNSRNYDHTVDVGTDTIYTVTDLTPGFEYFFAVTAYDTAGNESSFSEEVSYFLAIPDTIPPTLISANLVTANQLRINFSEKIDQTTATNILNYQINNGIIVTSAVLDTNGQTVTLTTSSHGVGNYILTVNNITDQADPANVIAPNSQIEYSYTESTPFEITEIQVVDTSHIIVIFSRNLDIVSAEEIDNYDIIPSIPILEANLDVDEHSVHLFTGTHDAGQYALVVSNIQDQSQPPQTIDPRTTMIYQMPDLV